MRTFSTARLILGAAAVSVFGAAAALTSAATVAPAADAAPAACTAGGLATTASGVLSQAGGYLNDHPEANDMLTAAANQAPDEARSTVRGYFVGHLDQLSALQNIAQPLTDLRNQCGVAVSPTQIANLMETLSG